MGRTWLYWRYQGRRAGCQRNQEKLECQWDLIIPRKLGAPFNREIAIGAVTQDGTLLLDEEMIKYLNVSKEYIEKEKKAQIEEIKEG